MARRPVPNSTGKGRPPSGLFAKLNDGQRERVYKWLAQNGQSEPARYGILFKLQIPVLLAHGPGATFISALLEKAIARALRDNGILCQTIPTEQNGFKVEDSGNVVFLCGLAIGLYEVFDLSAGLDAICDELASVEALECSEIGYLDYETRSWQCWYPRNSTEPFSKNVDLIREWSDKAKAKKQ